MSASVTSCAYCCGIFATAKRNALTCSAACRKAVSRALAAEEVDHVASDLRLEPTSDERARRTGWSTLTRRESYEADIRVRFAAGLPVPHPPHFLPGGHPDVFPKAVWITAARRAA